VVRVKPLLLTFTNLFPSSVMPTHGIFVYERMRRVAAEMPDFEWQVVAPVPSVMWPLRNATYQRWARVPLHERFQGVEVHHPRFRHWPGLSVRRQADAVAHGAMEVVRALTKGRPAVIDAHYVWPDGVAASKIADALSLPFVVTARGTDVNVLAEDPTIAARIQAMGSKASRLFAVSRALADRFATAAKLPADRVQVARNGVDMERFRPGDRRAARVALGLPMDARLVLGVGRLVSNKGFHLAADCLRDLPSDVLLVLVGEGPDQARIAAIGGDRVRFLGSLPPDQVAQACRACDVLTLPSEREGWPNVVTEALASGLRVVATTVGGIPEILGNASPGDGTLGRLVPWNDRGALLRALASTLAETADPMRVRSYAEQFGWAPPVAQLVDCFRAALAQSNPQVRALPQEAAR
jgi:teichuronic acid biosynthesis glycosyltransferase TuaC